MYAQQDANFNVTSLIGDTDAVTSGAQWGVVERDAYDAYGEPTFLDASFTALSGNVSGYAWTVLQDGMKRDANTEIYHVRNRDVNTGIWIQQDRVIGYGDGSNLYLAFDANPVDKVDPEGSEPISPDTAAPGQVQSLRQQLIAKALKEGRIVVDITAAHYVITLPDGSEIEKWEANGTGLPFPWPKSSRDSESPGPNWKWKGPFIDGAWVYKDRDAIIHPDPDHGPPQGPHWDYTDSAGKRYRVYPDATMPGGVRFDPK